MELKKIKGVKSGKREEKDISESAGDGVDFLERFFFWTQNKEEEWKDEMATHKKSLVTGEDEDGKLHIDKEDAVMKSIDFKCLLIICFISLISCTSGKYAQKSFADVQKVHLISTMGQPNKDIIDAIDVWGAVTFGDWSHRVKQTVIEDRGIFVFRYSENYTLSQRGKMFMSEKRFPTASCDVLVSVKVAKTSDKVLTVKFSNITPHGVNSCSWINADGVDELSNNFSLTVTKIREAIEEFHKEY